MELPREIRHLIPQPPNVSPLAMEYVLSTLRDLGNLVDLWEDAPDGFADALKTANHGQPGSCGIFGSQPSRGFITKFPLFSALWATPRKSGLDAALPQHIVHAAARTAQLALLISIALVADRADIAKYKSAIQATGRACRRICALKDTPEPLLQGLASARSLADVQDAIKACMPPKFLPSHEQEQLLEDLRVFITDAQKNRPPRRRDSKSGAVSVVRKERNEVEDDDLAPSHKYFDEEIQASKEAIAEGMAPCSEQSGRRLATVAVHALAPSTSLSPKQLILRAAGKARGIAASAQGLLLASDRLHLVDLMALANPVRDYLSGGKVLSAADVRGAMAVCASLLLGRDIPALGSLRVVQRLSDVPPDADEVFLSVSEGVLSFRPPLLERAFRPTPEEARWYRSVCPRLTLPLPIGLGFGELLLRHARNSVGSRILEGKHYEDDAKAFVSLVNRSKQSRITLPRVADFLSRQAVVHSGDWAEAALLSGTGDANARLYYYTPSQDKLLKLWRTIWEGVGRGMGWDVSMANASEPAAGSQWIGSQCCPTEDGVARMVGDLISACRKSLSGRRSKDRLFAVHNALALYTCMMVMWATGARGVDDPIDLTFYDPSTGLLALSDKDSNEYYASRVASLPPTAWAQVNEYSLHLRALRKNLTEVRIPEVDRLFFFDSRGKTESVTTSALKRFLPKNYPYRLNAQRHYLRTALRERGVAAQTVDALLGHGARGQEPYAKYSCFSPRRLLNEVCPTLEHLMKEAGWTVLKGLRA